MTIWYLQKTLTTNGNTFGFSGTNIQFAFDTAITKVAERIAKKYGGDVLRPYNRGNWNKQPSQNILIDLKQLTWEWTINGVLANTSGNMSSANYGVAVLQNGSAVSDTAINKKCLLEAFAEQGGVMTWVERNSSVSYSVNIISLEFTDIETEVGTSEVYMKPGEQRIAFTMILRKGVDRG